MTSVFLTSDHPAVEGTQTRIVADGEIQQLDYDGAVTAHPGTLWWGAAVGYRAMQAAAQALSARHLWQRGQLYVVSGHPGPGVLDALDYVTGCRANDHLKVLENPRCKGMCNAEMKFEWWVCDGRQTAHITLREDFVPQSFYDLTERLFGDVSDEDKRLFELFKVTLSAKIWNAPLEDSFSVVMEDVVAVGAVPRTTDWNPDLMVETALA